MPILKLKYGNFRMQIWKKDGKIFTAKWNVNSEKTFLVRLNGTRYA